MRKGTLGYRFSRPEIERGAIKAPHNLFYNLLTVGEAAAVLKPLSAPYELTTAGACARTHKSFDLPYF